MVMNNIGSVARGEDCFGREELVNLIWDKLETGHILLVAPRRFGKTSIMYCLLDNPKTQFKLIHMDVEYFQEPSELISEMLIKIKKLSSLSKIFENISSFSGKILSKVKDNISEVDLYKIKIKLKDENMRKNWKIIGEEIFYKISSIKEKIVFILDEFPMMIDRMAKSEKYKDDAITLLRWLRAIRMEKGIDNIRFIIAGSIGFDHVLKDLNEAPSIMDLERIKVEPFTPKTAGDYLDFISRKSEIALSLPSKKKILELIGIPVPYFLKILFCEVEKSHRLEKIRITPKYIEKIYHEKVLGVDCKTYFDHYHGRLKDYYSPQEEKASKKILRELSVNGFLTQDACYQFYKKESGSQKSDREEFLHLMIKLENDFYIHFISKKNGYEFACKLLRDWWLRHYGLSTGF